ncbi:MAG: hypothetical protein OER91_06425 [Gammaproteobacteria bacterium]|nr:hypothetical protein [Gammaproteobacteria bacterium]
MKTDVVRNGGALVALLGFLGTAYAQAEEPSTDGYIMTVYSNMAHGEKILDGSENKAISKLARGDNQRAGYLEGQINLCVAYTKAKEVERATEACDSAIELSLKDQKRRKRTTSFGRYSIRVAETGRAIALTNRGVLHAIVGEAAQARAKFEMAMELQSTEQSAKTNLALLERRIASSRS